MIRNKGRGNHKCKSSILRISNTGKPASKELPEILKLESGAYIHLGYSELKCQEKTYGRNRIVMECLDVEQTTC